MEFELDLERVARMVPNTIMCKGVFINQTLRLSQDQFDDEEILRMAGVPLQRFVPFRDYPWIDFFRIAAVVGQVISDGASLSHSLRMMGRTYFSQFSEGVPGTLLFGALACSPDLIIPLGPKAWRMANNFGSLRAESMGDRHYRYHLYGQPTEVVESIHVGVLEGVFEHCSLDVSLQLAAVDEMTSIIDFRW